MNLHEPGLSVWGSGFRNFGSGYGGEPASNDPEVWASAFRAFILRVGFRGMLHNNV